MSVHQKSRLNRRSADRLLDGRPADGVRHVARVLAAAQAAPSPHELRGEHAAVAMFECAHPAPTAADSRRSSLIKSAIANLLAAKVLIGGAIAVAATGGLAVAAGTGALPGSAGHAAPPNSAAASRAHHGKPAGVGAAGSQAPAPSGSPAAPGNAHPTPSLPGLCHAYQAGATRNPGKALQNPAFTALVTAAGGTDNVTSFCANLIGASPSHSAARSTHPHGAPSSHPGGKPSTHPGGGPPSSHPGNGPTTHPTGPPSNHPSGAPTTHPGNASSDHHRSGQ